MSDNSFIDYNSSQIVPQKALLEKFNKLIQYFTTNEFLPEGDIITTEDIQALFN